MRDDGSHYPVVVAQCSEHWQLKPEVSCVYKETNLLNRYLMAHTSEELAVPEYIKVLLWLLL